MWNFVTFMATYLHLERKALLFYGVVQPVTVHVNPPWLSDGNGLGASFNLWHTTGLVPGSRVELTLQP